MSESEQSSPEQKRVEWENVSKDDFPSVVAQTIEETILNQSLPDIAGYPELIASELPGHVSQRPLFIERLIDGSKKLEEQIHIIQDILKAGPGSWPIDKSRGDVLTSDQSRRNIFIIDLELAAGELQRRKAAQNQTEPSNEHPE